MEGAETVTRKSGELWQFVHRQLRQPNHQRIAPATMATTVNENKIINVHLSSVATTHKTAIAASTVLVITNQRGYSAA